MRIKYGSIITEGSGKLGGHVAVRNSNGSVLRAFSPPVKQHNAHTSKSKSLMVTVSAAWSALTASQKALWNSCVNKFSVIDMFGDVKKLSGYIVFQKLNLNLLHCSQSLLTAPPSLSNSPANMNGLSVHTASEYFFSIILPYYEVDTYNFLIYIAVNMSVGKSFCKNEYRLVKIFTGYPTYTLSITTEINARFGSVGRPLSRYFLRVHNINKFSGIASPPAFVTGQLEP